MKLIKNNLKIFALFVIAFLPLLSWTCGSTENRAQNQRPGNNNLQDRVQGEYLVTIAGMGGAEEVRRIFSEFGSLTVTPLTGTPGVFLLKFSPDPGLETLQKRASQSGQIQSVQPNFIYHINQKPGGPQ